MRKLKAIIRGLRPHQWFKNTFLYAGVFFAGEFLHVDMIVKATLGFVAFCLLSSGIYYLNDIIDVEADRAHPDKRKRPIASGEISIPLAAVIAAVLLVGGGGVSLLIGMNFIYFALGYVGIQLLYVFLFKRQPILDILTVASGFVIRAAASGAAVDVPISSWLLLCTSLLALFLVTEKRRSELARIESEESGHTSRPMLEHYSVRFLDNLAAIEVSATLVAYSFYVFSEDIFHRFGNHALGLSLPFVFYGLLRYLWLVQRENKGESPTKVFLTDLASIINIVLWALTVFLIIYFS